MLDSSSQVAFQAIIELSSKERLVVWCKLIPWIPIVSNSNELRESHHSRANGNQFVRSRQKFLESLLRGNDGVQYNLGIMYARGDGVRMDQRKALYWLAKSARQGPPRALECLKLRLEQKNSAGGRRRST